MDSRKDYIVSIIDFDISKLVIKEPTINKLVLSDIVYKHDDEEYNLFLDPQDRFSYSIQEIYPYESSEEDEKICTGLQFSYFIDKPGEEESSDRIKSIFDDLVMDTEEFVQDECNKDCTKLPETITSAIASES